jgi:hypothetical protein
MDLESLQRAMVWVNPINFTWGQRLVRPLVHEKHVPQGTCGSTATLSTFSHRRYAFADFENETCCFMAKNTIPLNFQLSNGAPLPEMYVGSNMLLAATSSGSYQVTYPQIPVALM